MNTNRLSALGLITATATLVGCFQTASVTEETGSASGSLVLAQTCGQLEALLEADALAKMNAQIDAQISWLDDYGSGNGGPVSIGGTRGVSSDDDSMSEGASSGTGGENAPTAGGADDGASDPKGHSDTNVQIEGVDEADIVKVSEDGKTLYLVHGSTLQVLNTWPAAALAATHQVAIEGSPFELFIEGNRAVVFSTVDGNDIYTAAGIAPRAPYYDGYYGWGFSGGGRAEPGIEGDGPVSSSGSGSSSGSDGEASDPVPPSDSDEPLPEAKDIAPDTYPGSGEVYTQLTKITVIDLSGATPTIANELYFEGSYSSSRRVNADVRTVLTGAAYGPQVQTYPSFEDGNYPQNEADMIAALEALRAKNTAIIVGATAADWLPYRFVKSGTTVTASQLSCDQFYVPGPGSTQYGMTQVQSFNLESPETLSGVGIVGATDTVFSTADTMYLAARAWQDPYFGGAPPLPGLSVSTATTFVHKFDVSGTPAYAGTGAVDGYLLNQFSLDEYNGDLRVATTDTLVQYEGSQSWNSKTVTNLTVLREAGDSLATVGFVGGLAEDEQIYSARFVGARGYIVTFRQVDPLFVLDLSNPEAPTVEAELKIPGFSEYMHPLGTTHLLTIGRDGTDEGQVNGLALKIFDVTDAKNPQQTHTYSFSGNDWGGYSEASYNHKAFTYWAEKGLLAFPYVGYQATNCGEDTNCEGGTAWGSFLEVFSATADGITRLGEINHSGFFADQTDPNYCGYGIDVRRGVFIDDYVYAISYGGVTASPLSDLASIAGSVALPSPYAEACYYDDAGGEDDVSGTGGSDSSSSSSSGSGGASAGGSSGSGTPGSEGQGGSAG